MSTLGSLMALFAGPDIQPYNAQELTANRIQSGNITNATELLQLAELRRQQEAQAQARQYYQQNPGALLGTQSTLGSLGPPQSPGAAPAPGPITQQTFGPGGVTGPTQTIPAPMQPNANLGATGGMPMPTLATLGPPPQANPLEALVRTNPDAAVAVLNQQTKMQEQQLNMRVKVADYMGSVLQGVTSQESYDEARREIARVSPQWAQALPQGYSKEALEPFIQRALDVKTQRTLQLNELQRQTELAKARLEAGTAQAKLGEVEYKDTPQGLIAVPKYPTAAGGPGGVGGTQVTLGGTPVQGTAGQTQLQQQRSSELALMKEYQDVTKNYREVRDAIGRIETSGHDTSAAGDLSMIYAFMKMLDPQTGIRESETRLAATTGGIMDRLEAYIGQLKSGKKLSDDVRADFLNRSRMLYAQYQKDYEGVGQQYREVATRQGLNPANVVLDQRSSAAQPASTGQPRLLSADELQSLAAQRSRALGRLVTLEEVQRDLDPKRFRTQ